MIRMYKNENAFSAIEDLLFVPLPIESNVVTGGFAADVFSRFPLARARFMAKNGGLRESEILVVGNLGSDKQWAAAPYSLALSGIHSLKEGEGWRHSPRHLADALNTITTNFGTAVTLASAGIPGTGYSGLAGGADPEEMRAALDAHELQITVYRDNYAGDRAALLADIPNLDGAVRL